MHQQTESYKQSRLETITAGSELIDEL